MKRAGLVLLLAFLVAGAFLIVPRESPAPAPPSPEPARSAPAPGSPDPAGPLPEPAPARAPLAPAASAPTEARTSGGAVLVSGRVSIYESRRRIGEAGESVAGARVRLSAPATGVVLGSAETGSDGAFTLAAALPPEVLPADLLVEVSKEGLLSWTGSRHAVTIEALPFERGDLDLVLNLPREIEGRVLEAIGEVPVPGARVLHLLGEGIGPKSSPVRRFLRRPAATAGSSGQFRMSIPAGHVFSSFVVEAEGHRSVVARWSPIAPPADGVLVVRLPRETDLPRVEGTVRDGEGRPLGGATVWLEWGPQAAAGAGLPAAMNGPSVAHREFLELGDPGFEARTDAGGSYSVPLWTTGAWRIAARSGGLLEEKTVQALEPCAYACDFTLAGSTVTFAGTVRAKATGRCVPGAEVTAWAEWVRWLGTMETRADEAGEFRIGPVPAMGIAFRVAAPGFATRSHDVRPEAGAEECRVVVEMEEEGRIRGRAMDDRGEPVRRAEVVAYAPPADVFSRGKADERGVFELGMLPIGTKFDLTVSGFAAGGQVMRTLELTLEAAGEVRDVGTVVLAAR